MRFLTTIHGAILDMGIQPSPSKPIPDFISGKIRFTAMVSGGSCVPLSSPLVGVEQCFQDR